MSYNGWTNYETWNTALYFVQDGQFDDAMSEYWERDDDGDIFTDVNGLAYHIRDIVQEYIDTEYSGNGYLSDMIGAALSEVNWREIAETLLEDYEPENEEED